MAASFRPQDSFGQARSLESQKPDYWPKSYFLPGTIICTLVCETHKRQTAKIENKKFQAPMPPFKDVHFFCYKYRYFIVVKNFYDHYFALPLWSFGRQGLKGKPLNLRQEYIGIRDYRLEEDHEDPRPTVRELVTEEMHNEDRLFPESIVWITRAESLF